MTSADSEQPYIVAAIFVIYNTWHSDKLSLRSPFLIGPSLLTLAGIIITMATTNTAARYFSLFLMLPGTYGCFQVSNAWMSNIAARPKAKRAIAIAMNNSFGNLALVWTPYLYPTSAGPRYTTAWSVNLALTVVVIASSLGLHFVLKRENKKMDEAEAAGYTVEEGHKADSSQVEVRPANVTAGRRLGGANAGATARFDT
jgi:MFS family permease